MKFRRVIYAVVIILITVFSIGFKNVNENKITKSMNNEYQHIEEMKEGADPSLGITDLSDNYEVQKDFVSHLPLVVIDTEEKEIPEAYEFDSQQKRFVLKDNSINPYISGNISVIDNDNNVNRLGDEPKVTSAMDIKYRGNSSIHFDKHQYRIKLLTDDGQSNKVEMMGMAADQDWILNISMIDSSLIRNYMVYNISSQIMEFTPKAKYCEVIKKEGDKYIYEGLYLMMESIKQGNERVNIDDYNPKENYTSYLLRRDRYDEEGLMITDTYALNNNLGYGYLDIRYPSPDEIDQKAYNYIHNDINNIEKILYSDDKETFMKYDDYLDEDSFVDYFIINEFFANYDAGNNSTYMYKNPGGKLKMGPIWDYDNAADNMGQYLLDAKSINFKGQTWFSELTKSQEFCRRLKKRYAELSKTILSIEYVDNFIDDTMEYLGNAKVRDWKRWKEQYTKKRFDLLEDTNGIVIDRNYDSIDECVQRVKDVLYEHSQYMSKGLQKLEDDSIFKVGNASHEKLAIIFILTFFASIILIRRRIKN